MLNKCIAEKLFIEICDDKRIDTVIPAGFEFFSSMFHSIKNFVRDQYPIKQNGRKDLITFEG